MWKVFLLWGCATLVLTAASDDTSYSSQETSYSSYESSYSSQESQSSSEEIYTEEGSISQGCGGDPNAKPGCGVNCGRTCSTYKKKPGACPHVCKVNGCDCKDNYVFDDAVQRCVLPADCTPTCGTNEVYSNCTIPGCSILNCSQLSQPVPFCPKYNTKSCIKGCICQTGFLRASNGTCVPKSQCDTGCGGDPNAKPGCGVNCGRTCSTYKKKPGACPHVCKVNGCDCKDNYVFDDAVQRCVLPKDCMPTCGINEIASNCSNGECGPYTCSDLGYPIECPKPEKCLKGCICQNGYVRNENGTCIPKTQCTGPCGGDPNARPGCGVNCGKTCSTYKIKSPICPYICNPNACDCKDKFVYDPNIKKCVLPENCTPPCGPNQVYSICTNGECTARNCSQLGKPVPCVKLRPESCLKGCVCQKDYLRASNGTCVPKGQCPPVKCGRNEVYDVCPAPCPPQQCGVNPDLVKCAKPPQPGDAACNPGCRCADNYVRNSKGKCVLRSQCDTLPTCGINEIASNCSNGECGPYTCSDLGYPIACPKPEKCRKGCICQNGYVRNENGTCVPKSQCTGPCGGDPNARPGCGVNCGKTCSTYKSKSPKCPKFCNPNACDCKDNFVYDPNINKCVLPKDCTPPCGPNQVYSICTNGECTARNCSQLGKPVPCVKLRPESCLKGCVCQKDYLRASNGTCVPKGQCPPVKCGRNEVYDVCPATCPPRQCGVNPATVRCAKPPQPGDAACNPGCRCADNYVRNSKGICVLRSQCDTPKDCGPNEKYDSCAVTCPPQKCGINPALVLCAAGPKPGDAACQPACRCIDGYVRNDTDVCIPKEKCPKDCGPNEKYDPCAVTCPPQKCGINPAAVSCTPSPRPGDAACQPACKCIDGYVRNDTDVCIPEEECPQCTGANEYYETCIQGCSNQTCNDIGKRYNCPNQPVCKSGCRCNPGFWRDSDNVCIPQSQCPTPPCPDGEIYEWCPTVRCDADYCPKTRNTPFTCPVGITCDPPRCICGFNRRRERSSGKCIATSNCPPFPCNGPNEEYQSCPPICPGENCTDYINDSKCPRGRIGIVVECKPQCKCKKGYYRDSKGVCIIGYKCGPKNTTTTTTTTTTTPVPIDNNNGSTGADITSLQAGIIDFTGKFLHDRMLASPGENIIISAFSVFTPLAELALYAIKESFQQLISLLNLKTKADIRSIFPAFTASYDGQTTVEFDTANKFYSNIIYQLSDSLKRDAVNVFRAECEEIDFGKPVQAAKIINTWVENKTKNRIQGLVSPDMLDADTRIVLVNAIYFKGNWVRQFNKNNTKDANFYLADGTTKKTKLMYQEANFKYGEVEELNCKVLELPYKGNNFSMLIALPNNNDGVTDLANYLRDSSNYYKLYQSLRSEKVKVYVPPFEIKTTTDLAPMLQKRNVTKIFSKDSGIQGILKKPEDVYISQAVQKAFIKCDETGSEAAAANAIIVGTTSAIHPPPKQIIFRADHGFIYYIIRKGSTNVPIFSGVFRKPD